MKTGSHSKGQRGMSLVELMVGIAIGLIVVAGAALALSGQLTENSRLVVEAQLQQDLRATADIIGRELRRSGAQRETAALEGVWRPGKATTMPNLYAEAQNASTPALVRYTYEPSTGAVNRSGFRLTETPDGVGLIQQRMLGAEGASTWQEVTDSTAIDVVSFAVTPASQDAISLPCPKLCPPPALGTACWPSVTVRELHISITAKARRFPEIQRTLNTSIRVRNDHVKFSNIALNQVCPA